MKRLIRPALLGLLIYGVTFGVIVASEMFWPRDVPQMQADAIVCLGGGTSEVRLYRTSAERAAQCIEIYRTGAAPLIVFSGIGAGPLMADMARANGVPDEAILVESDSRSTLQNALFTADLIPADTPIILVTDAFHLPRSWVSFRVMGFDDQTLVASGAPRVNIKFLAREALAVWFNAGRIALWWATPWMDPETRAMFLI